MTNNDSFPPETPLGIDDGTGARFVPRSPRTLIEPELAPPPPPAKKPRHPFVSFLSSVFTLVLICALFSVAAIYFLKTRLVADGPLETATTLVIPPRSGMADIAKLLSTHGVLNEPTVFQAGVIINEARGLLKAGEYYFPAAVSMQAIIDILREGKSILHPVTIPEGLTSQQIVQRLMNYDVLVGEIKTIPPEGSLLPDTYKVQRGMSRNVILQRMTANQKKLLEDLWRRKPEGAVYKTPQEMTTLASIVEKETGKAEERPRVAAVFINRLKKRMRLQSDPTIIYGLAGGQGTLNRSITREDITRPTPYNTYTIEALPPTPIANPGRASLEAVVAPATSNDLYFVADGSGGHAFAPTLEEHNRNVSRWREFERSRGNAIPETEAAVPETPVVIPDPDPNNPGPRQSTVPKPTLRN